MKTAGRRVAGMLLCLSLSCSVRTGPVRADPPEDEFARQVTHAIRHIGAGHITPASRADLARWAVAGLYHAAGEPVPPELAARLDRLEGAGEGEFTAVLREARGRLGKREGLEDEAVVEAALSGIFAGLEPVLRPEERSGYIRKDKVRRFDMGGGVRTRSGVGLQVERDATTGMLRVRTPALGGPAYRAGLRAGDLITHITVEIDEQGKPLARPRVVATQKLSPAQADELLLGQDGTPIKLSVILSGHQR